MTQDESRAKQLRQIEQSIRARAACEHVSTDVLRAHYRRLHERREAMVMRGVADGSWRENYSLRGVIFDVGTQMIFAISGVLGERRAREQWAAARGLRGAA